MEIKNIENKYNDILHLTANENVMSPLAERYFSTSIANRYRMGARNSIFKSGNFASKGMSEVDELIEAASLALMKMTGGECVNLNCLSGAHAMICSILACTNVGDTVLTVKSNHGGHFCTKGLLEITGRKNVISEYDYENYTFDVKKLAEICKENNVKAIYLDTSVMIRNHPIRELRKLIGDEIIIIYDASHTLGLIMGGEFQNPFEEGADVISANTHKTLPGPHHGLIVYKNKEFGEKANKVATQNLYSSTHVNEILALSITILEMEKWGGRYAKQVVKNANCLGEYLERHGLQVRKMKDGTYTKSHQLHLYFEGCTNVEIVNRFLDNNVSVTTSKALGDRLFIRLGMQEITRRGLVENDIEELGNIIIGIMNNDNMTKQVENFINRFREVHYGYQKEDENKILSSIFYIQSDDIEIIRLAK